MKRTLSYTITNKNKADTIGAFLRDAGYSRRILIELKQNPEQICLNGTPSWLNTPLQIGALSPGRTRFFRYSSGQSSDRYSI